eukprot:1639334-Pleurochrysis_carterae.AAC.1
MLSCLRAHIMRCAPPVQMLNKKLWDINARVMHSAQLYVQIAPVKMETSVAIVRCISDGEWLTALVSNGARWAALCQPCCEEQQPLLHRCCLACYQPPGPRQTVAISNDKSN